MTDDFLETKPGTTVSFIYLGVFKYVHTGVPVFFPPLNHEEHGPVHAVRFRYSLAWSRNCWLAFGLGRMETILSICIFVMSSTAYVVYASMMGMFEPCATGA